MITTVTTATVAATSVIGWGIALGAGGAFLVLGLLIALELIGSGDGSTFRSSLHRAMRIAAPPLLIVFAVSVAAKAISVLAS